jgi:hypothetical protein
MTHRIRPVVLAVAFALLGAAVALTWYAGGGAVPVIAGIAGPDLAFLAAIGAQHAPGRLPRRAVVPYNVAHHPVGPVLVLAIAIGLRNPAMAVLAIAWMSHLAWDRGVGYGLRGPAGEITDGILRPGASQ